MKAFGWSLSLTAHLSWFLRATNLSWLRNTFRISVLVTAHQVMNFDEPTHVNMLLVSLNRVKQESIWYIKFLVRTCRKLYLAPTVNTNRANRTMHCAVCWTSFVLTAMTCIYWMKESETGPMGSGSRLRRPVFYSCLYRSAFTSRSSGFFQATYPTDVSFSSFQLINVSSVVLITVSFTSSNII